MKTILITAFSKKQANQDLSFAMAAGMKLVNIEDSMFMDSLQPCMLASYACSDESYNKFEMLRTDARKKEREAEQARLDAMFDHNTAKKMMGA